MSPCCLVVAFLLPDALTNTAQTYYPPCQLGQLPSSRISYGYPGPRAQNPQQTGAPELILPTPELTPLSPIQESPQKKSINLPSNPPLPKPPPLHILPSPPLAFTSLSTHLLPYPLIINILSPFN
jgi:hypothetical protein